MKVIINIVFCLLFMFFMSCKGGNNTKDNVANDSITTAKTVDSLINKLQQDLKNTQENKDSNIKK
ncbi:MAG TPA: hypothetical protein P5250_08060 [Bacteroidales bacterium]|nr:hypothetical protein [Bacteroidales bacterium]